MRIDKGWVRKHERAAKQVQETFWVEPLNALQETLFRWTTSAKPCIEKDSVHEAKALMGVQIVRVTDDLVSGLFKKEGDNLSHEDPRWPTKCSKCDYKFVETDKWNTKLEQVWGTLVNGQYHFCGTLETLPIGAMYDAPWLTTKGPDGKSLVVVLPDNSLWYIDVPISRREGWSRLGVPPNITAKPSIKTEDYHGYLISGTLFGD